MAHYLSYWTPQNAHGDEGLPFACAWSSRFDKVKQGDVIWMVSSENKSLYLLARGTVEEILPQSKAKKHPFFKDKKNWPVESMLEKYWVIIEEPRMQISWIDITPLAMELRFESKLHPTLYENPAKWGNALQTLHTLTPASAQLLEDSLSGSTVSDQVSENKFETLGVTIPRTVANYTTYWKPQTAESNAGSLVGRSSSAQYKRLMSGDVLWVLMVKDAHLFLVGMGEIEDVMTDEQASERFGNDNFWEAAYHVVFKRPWVPYELRDITAMSKDIRFEGSNSSLPDEPGKWATALRTLRKLTPDSVILLTKMFPELAIGGPLQSIQGSLVDSESPEEEEARTEGKEILRSHLRRERLAYFRDLKLRESMKPYQCEACEMTFEQKYGYIGKDFIEVHHKNQIADGERYTNTKEDLALLCSNCHRMIHKTDNLSDIESFKKKHLQV